MNRLTAMNRFSAFRTQKGVSLLEVLIVFFVLSVGLLGMAALQIKSMQYNQSAYIRSQASVAAYDILDRMRMNRAIATSDGYDVALAAAASTATGGTLAVADLTAWKAFLLGTLPNGDGSVACTGSVCTITVQWTDRLGASGSIMSLVVDAQI